MKEIKKKLLIVLSICILLVGCSNEIIKEDTIKLKEYKKEYGFKRNQYNYALPSLKDEEFIEIANKILDGKLIVEKNISDYAEFEQIENINWDIIVGDSPNTYQLYLQCLNPIVFLTRAYELTQDEKYINVAKEFLTEWIKYKETNPENNFLWYDHGTALRLENIIYFMLVAEESDITIAEEYKIKLNILIEEHIEYLYDDKNYTENHNHGIFQDRALMYGAYFLNNNGFDEYMKKFRIRLDSQIEYGFNEEMIHVENSPGYQTGVVQIIYQIAGFLEQFNDQYGNELMDKVKQSNDFLKYIMKPNAGLAEIGDTNSLIKDVTSNVGYKFGDDELIYASTWGQEGAMPTINSVIYPKAGYYMYRSSWEKENFKNATWTMFKSGYTSKTHKHADDLSFMLYSKGKDIFVDPGWYNYVTGNKYRDYLISSKAHNTVIVDSKSYSATEPNSYKVGIVESDLSNENYDYVLGFNKMYEGVQIDRHFYYLKEDAILLYDDIVSEEQHTYSQLFHTSEYMEMIESNDNEVLMSLKDTQYNVRIKQLAQNTNLVVHRGETEQEEYGYLSREMNKVQPIYTLEFKQEADSTKYITLITIEDKEGNNIALDQATLNNNKNEISITKDNHTYTITLIERERIDASQVIRKQIDKDIYSFTSTVKNKESLSYAWYIIDEEDGKVLEKIPYSTNNELIYAFKEEKNYLIKSYVKNKQGETDYAFVGCIRKIDDKYIDETDKINNFKLKLGEHYYQDLGNNNYKFVIPYDYFWKTSVKWYIYKDGGYYTTINGENVLEYQFNEPGEYTVMYYFRTLNGDMEYWNYKPIKIF